MEEATNFDSERVFTLLGKIMNLNQTLKTNIFITKQLPVVDQLKDCIWITGSSQI
jgi:hypothetical protein